MTEAQRLAALVVARVLAGRSLDAELRSAWTGACIPQGHTRAIVQDACFGTLRHLGQIDAVLERLLKRPLHDAAVHALVRVALYQLIHTRAPAHAVVDHAVQASAGLGRRWAKGLVNGLLRNFLRRSDELLTGAASTDEGRFSHPRWWIEKLRADYPHDYARILECANRHPPLTLRVNRRRTTPAAYLAQLNAEGLDAYALGGSAVVLRRPQPVGLIPGFMTGEVSVQDAAAQLAAFALTVEDGMRVLDACAAPGGKSAHLLELADIDLTALDVDHSRLSRVRENLTRLGLNARLVCGDAVETEGWFDGRPFDRILADVPCSASGIVRRHPDIKWLRRPDDIRRYAERQAVILGSLWQVLAAGGKLLYATCSVFQEEGGMQIARFLERHPDARCLDLPAPQSNPQMRSGQILPDEHHDGFFYALLQRA
jgi:16S rRNA (cytosine967-C5)-methyltransferase